MKYIGAAEMIQTFKSGAGTDLDKIMVRALENDMENIFFLIRKQIRALPKRKREIIYKRYLELLENEMKKDILK